MVILQTDGIRKLGEKIFAAQGAPERYAKLLASNLVEANLTGHDSHGVRYYILYSERIKDGWIDPKAKPDILTETESHAVIDGNWAFGQVTALQAVKLCIKKAKDNVIAAVGTRRCNHIGRVGYFTQHAANKGIICMMFVNVSHPIVAIYNGLGRCFGTNPFSLSIPTRGETPFLLDYATSVVAHGKISVARAKPEKVPMGWLRDKYGRRTEDPNALWDGGWLLPFGRYKGYALQLVMELLGGVLTESFTGFDKEKERPSTNGVLTVCINPEGFTTLKKFTEKTEEMFRYIKSRESSGNSKIMIPGEPEKFTREKRLRDGIYLPQETWNDIVELSRSLKINPGIALKK